MPRKIVLLSHFAALFPSLNDLSESKALAGYAADKTCLKSSIFPGIRVFQPALNLKI
jgi:hypothetical protein